MKRRLKYFFAVFALLTLFLCMSLPFWIFGSARGVETLLKTVSRYSSVQISAKKISQTSDHSINLENLTFSWPQGKVQIRHLFWNYHPLNLLTGRVSLRHLSARDVEIVDLSPEKPPDLRWPKAPYFIQLFKGDVLDFTVRNVTYRHLKKDSVSFSEIHASLLWEDARLRVKSLRLASAQGRVTGDILAGFGSPLLEINLEARPSSPLVGMDLFSLQGKFSQGKSPRELMGNLVLLGKSNQKSLWRLDADAGMTATGFPLSKIRLQRLGRPDLLTAEGMLTVSGPLPFLKLSAKTQGFDLFKDFKIPLSLAGSLDFAGTMKNYEGKFSLANRSKNWQAISINGSYGGNDQGLRLKIDQAQALKGALQGQLNIGWQKQVSIFGHLSGSNLNPAAIDRKWNGVVNFCAAGQVDFEKDRPVEGKIEVTLLQSRLHGRQLIGQARATFLGENVMIENMMLQGKGFQLTAAGAIKSRVNLNLRIEDLSRLVPQTSGVLAASGWMRLHNGRMGGILSASGRQLAFNGMTVSSAKLEASIADQENLPFSLSAVLKEPGYNGQKADLFTAEAKGALSLHTINAFFRSQKTKISASLTGAWRQGKWQGNIARLDGEDVIGPWKLTRPAALTITANDILTESLTLTGGNAEMLSLSGWFAPASNSGTLDCRWTQLNLSRANLLLSQWNIEGITSGTLAMKLLPQKRLEMTGSLSASGTLQAQGQTINIRQSSFTLNAGQSGIQVKAEMIPAEGGSIQGDFSSSFPAGLQLPDKGNFNLAWREFDMTPYCAWLPGSVKLEGKMSGSARGSLLANRRFSLTGQTTLAESGILLRGQRGDVKLRLRNATLQWNWQNETLSGSVALRLARQGKIQGLFRLPVAAHLPVRPNPTGNLEMSLNGRFREKGGLSLLFPELVQESQGELDVALRLDGQWDNPQIGGTVRLTDAGGYLPGAGITLQNVSLLARLDKNVIHIDTFRATSGKGEIVGQALVRMKGKEVESYEGVINGKNFQTVYFPELQVQSSPKLSFSGTPEKLTVRGEVSLPTIQITGAQPRSSLQASPDVIRKGKRKATNSFSKLPFKLDAQVKMILGDAVSFQASGIDAQLGGQIDLKFQNLDSISGRGEIRVVKGRFRTYGVNLDIVRGNLFYAGGPINQPALDILALRKLGDVRAGVTVTGSLPHPIIKLYSEPFMQDMDILAYIVLGHPLGGSSEQAGLMAMAAGALLTSKQSEQLQQQIRTRLGFDTLHISADVLQQNDYMGYKRIATSPDGKTASSTTGSVPETMLVVGKYLTPDLYISYGRSLFSGGNLFFLRYNLSKSWQVETQTGQESGVDIYYKIEFH